MLDDRADPGDAGGDQDQVADRADRDDGADELPEEALPQHERVLRSDRDDQRQAGQEDRRAGRQARADARRAVPASPAGTWATVTMGERPRSGTRELRLRLAAIAGTMPEATSRRRSADGRGDVVVHARRQGPAPVAAPARRRAGRPTSRYPGGLLGSGRTPTPGFLAHCPEVGSSEGGLVEVHQRQVGVLGDGRARPTGAAGWSARRTAPPRPCPRRTPCPWPTGRRRACPARRRRPGAAARRRPRHRAPSAAGWC